GDTAFVLNMDIQEISIYKIEIAVNNNARIGITYRTRKNNNSNSAELVSYIENKIYDTRYEAARAWFARQELEPNDIIQSVFTERKETKKDLDPLKPF
ncbi:MAG: hypothetical protein ACTSU6_00300, partial [Candidatus Njordarchaeales archaeon]